jgi:hypothetical protein
MYHSSCREPCRSLHVEGFMSVVERPKSLSMTLQSREPSGATDQPSVTIQLSRLMSSWKTGLGRRRRPCRRSGHRQRCSCATHCSRSHVCVSCFIPALRSGFISSPLQFAVFELRDIRITSPQSMTHVAWSRDGKKLGAVGIDRITTIFSPGKSVSLSQMLAMTCIGYDDQINLRFRYAILRWSLS